MRDITEAGGIHRVTTKPRKSKRPSGVFGVMSILLLGLLAPELAVAQTCTKTPPCRASQLVDANGCCVDKPTTTSKPNLPKRRLWWSAHPSAHYFSDTIKTEALSKNASDVERATAAWRSLLALELQLMQRAQKCQRRPSHQPCLVAVKPMLNARTAQVMKSMPIWRKVLTTIKKGPDHDRARYQMGVASLLTGQMEQGVNHLKQLIERKDTPYRAFAMATLADYLYQQGQHKQAQLLYLRATQTRVEGLWSYAHMMQGWASANQGDNKLAIQAMVISWKLLSPRKHQLQGDVLRKDVLDGLAQLYSVAGQPSMGAAFIAQFQLTKSNTRGWLTRLARYYQQNKNYTGAMLTYQRLFYEGTTRQKAFYGHQWLEAKQQHQPRVDKPWSVVMQNWISEVAALSKQVPVPNEVALYQQQATQRLRQCKAQSALRPQLLELCLSTYKATLTDLKRIPSREALLFEYAQMAKQHKQPKEEAWALKQLLQSPAYQKAAKARLKTLKVK